MGITKELLQDVSSSLLQKHIWVPFFSTNEQAYSLHIHKTGPCQTELTPVSTSMLTRTGF